MGIMGEFRGIISFRAFSTFILIQPGCIPMVDVYKCRGTNCWTPFDSDPTDLSQTYLLTNLLPNWRRMCEFEGRGLLKKVFWLRS